MILVAYGTRPEIIKVFPIINELIKSQIPFKTVFTGQHLDLFEDVKDLIPEPNYRFNVFPKNGVPISLGQSFVRICSAAEEFLAKEKFDLVLVQGDTTTAWAIAQVAYFNSLKVGHIEAGLRTFDLENPFPEEFNRTLISQVAYLNFAPTDLAYKNLKKIGAQNVYKTGNTIVDAVNFLKNKKNIQIQNSNKVLITLHRRENHVIMGEIFQEIENIAKTLPDLDFIFPMHPNPSVQKHKSKLISPNIKVIKPVSYLEMLQHIATSRFIISDSGGVQEEATCFCKKILIVRNKTERSETVDVGLGMVVGKNIKSGIKWALEPPQNMYELPYGKGDAALQIVSILEKYLCNK